jgi:CAAX protease family protein
MNSKSVPDARWSVWATASWSAVVLALFVLVQAVFFGWYVATHRAAGPDGEPDVLRLQSDGDVIAIATLLAVVVCVPAIVGIVRMKRGSRLADYLPTELPSGRLLARWLGYTVVFLLASDAVSLVTGNPVVPKFMKEAYGSANLKLLLWVALTVASPVFEETFFRGFMISGFSRSWLGFSGAVLASAAVWAIVHIQYDWYGIATVFAFGLFLGTARVRTGTLVVPLLIHAAANAFATLEAAASFS